MLFSRSDKEISRGKVDRAEYMRDNLFIKLLIRTLVYEPNLATFICVIGNSKLPITPKLNPTL